MQTYLGRLLQYIMRTLPAKFMSLVQVQDPQLPLLALLRLSRADLRPSRLWPTQDSTMMLS